VAETSGRRSEPELDIVEVNSGGAGLPGADDRVDAGVEPSRLAVAFDRTVGRLAGPFRRLGARLGVTGIATITVLVVAVFIGSLAVTSGHEVPTAPLSTSTVRSVVNAAGCPNITRCAVREDADGPIGTALRAYLHVTSMTAFTTFNVDTGQDYRTMILASRGRQQFTVTSQCLPGVPLPQPHALTTQYVDSSKALNFGPYAYLSLVLVREPSCSVTINALVPRTTHTTVTDGENRTRTTVTLSDAPVRAVSIALANLSLTSGVWVR
jgi:hypothetical protein